MKLPIHCINLERASERKEYMLKEWKDYDLIFFNAIDRRDLEKNGDILPYNKNKTIDILGRELTFGERACLTSHYLLSKQLLDTDEEWFITGEDDIISYGDPNTLYEWIDKMIEESPDIDVFLLYRAGVTCEWGEKRKYSTVAKNPPWGCYLQLISKNGLLKYINHIENVLLPADYYWKFTARDGELAISNRIFARHKNLKDNNTYIGLDYRLPFIK